MHRLLPSLIALLIVATAWPAAAITNGEKDGDQHPAVAGLVADQAYSDGTWLYCSGTLVSPTVVVTAAHCADDEARVRVTFHSAYEDGDPVYSGIFQADPAFSQRQNDPHDLAVVVLDQPVEGIQPATLPQSGSLEHLPKDQSFVAVGYGAYEVTNQPGGHQYLYNDVRMVATSRLNATTKTWLRLSMNASRGDGGTCYGDSGGPNFLGDTSTLAAITITGDAVCRSTNVTYRLDTQAARAFLGQYVELP